METKCILVYIPFLNGWGLVEKNWGDEKKIMLDKISVVKTKSSTEDIGRENLIPIIRLSMKKSPVCGDDIPHVLDNYSKEIALASIKIMADLRTEINDLRKNILGFRKTT